MSVGISVIVPTYKRPDLLKRCLNSICSQTFDHYEVVVVDNDPGCSDVAGLVGSIGDARYKYVHETTPGVSAARNKGVEKSSGNLILFVDDDDEIAADMLEKMYGFMSDKQQTDVSFSWTGVTKLFEKNDSVTVEKKEFLVTEQDLENMSFIVKIGTGCGLCIRKKDFLEVGGFDKTYKLSEDRDLLIKLISAGKQYRPLNEFLYRRYYHAGERLSQSLHSLEEADHDYKLYYEHLNFIMRYPVLRLRLLDLRARHYFDGGELEKAIEIAQHAWQIQPWRIRSLRRLISYWLKSIFVKRKLSNSDAI